MLKPFKSKFLATFCMPLRKVFADTVTNDNEYMVSMTIGMTVCTDSTKFLAMCNLVCVTVLLTLVDSECSIRVYQLYAA